MPERLLQFMPFLAIDCDGKGRPKLNTARVIEIVLTLVAIWYGMNTAIARLETKVDGLSLQVVQLNSQFVSHIDKDKK